MTLSSTQRGFVREFLFSHKPEDAVAYVKDTLSCSFQDATKLVTEVAEKEKENSEDPERWDGMS